MSEEVSLKEILGDVATSASKSEASSDNMGWTEMFKMLKEIMKMKAEMAKLSAEMTPPPQPAAKGGAPAKPNPDERAERMYAYIKGFVGQLAQQFPDLTLKEINEQLPKFEPIIKQELKKIAKSL